MYDSEELNKIWITKYDGKGIRVETNAELVLQDSKKVLRWLNKDIKYKKRLVKDN